MALTHSVLQELGRPAPDFKLRGVDLREHSLADYKDQRALVVIFMCNHCPYVIAVQDRINELAKRYGPRGVAVVGINSNDSTRYPDDDFASMPKRAQEQGYAFHYLHDETQAVAKAYDAVCTPDPFVFENVDGRFVLRYHGRIDDSWKDPSAITRRDLADALEAILAGGPVNADQIPAMGCSIKWKP